MVVLEPGAGERVVYSDGEEWYWTVWLDGAGYGHTSLMRDPFSGDSAKVVMDPTLQHMAELMTAGETWP